MCWLSECECNVMLCDAPVMRVREPELPAPAREPARRPRLAPAPALAATDCERRPAEQHPQHRPGPPLSLELRNAMPDLHIDLVPLFQFISTYYLSNMYNTIYRTRANTTRGLRKKKIYETLA